MALSTKLLRMQLEVLKPLNNCSVETVRLAQDKLGELMAKTHKSEVDYGEELNRGYTGLWITPKVRRYEESAILYLHGGGYVAGDLEYAKGFGTILCAKNGIRVFCLAYRLAPEHPFPAALEDAFAAYQYMLECGYKPENIVFSGESAGGGLLFALALKLKKQGLPLPAGLIPISPWTDLTLSGVSYRVNGDSEPTLTLERVKCYQEYSTDDVTNPLVSPLFGDLAGLPPVLSFAGGDELLLSDAVTMHRKLLQCGVCSQLVVTPEMWHVYILYGVSEAKKDHIRIAKFLREVLHETEENPMDAPG